MEWIHSYEDRNIDLNRERTRSSNRGSVQYVDTWETDRVILTLRIHHNPLGSWHDVAHADDIG
jgi:hypothetical protein